MTVGSATLTHASVNGFDALVLDNGIVRAVVIPSLGGRVWELWDLRRDRQWIWHREDVPLARAPIGSDYDEVWAGGWEELFPNDAKGPFEGRDLPDHGEWWTLGWTVSATTEGDEAVLRLEATTSVRRVRAVKEFRLGAGESTLRVAYRIENIEAEDFHFLFKQHLPIAITSDCTLQMPGGRVVAVDPSFGTVLPGAGPYTWPTATVDGGAGVDMRAIPARDPNAREFIYIDQLAGDWCGVDDAASGAAIRMTFDREQFPYVWMFLSYGGWRECYTAVLEPCTNMPKELSEAVRRGQSAQLAVGAHFETRAAVTLRGIHED